MDYTNKNTYFLNPSKLFVSDEAYEVITVLGSCVAVVLYDQKNYIGGINHYMLPLWNGRELASPKYGNIAIEKLVNKMVEAGANQKHMIAKVFGGSEVIQTNHSMFRIGEKNVNIAHETLKRMKIPIVKESTGSKEGRKVLFRTNTGEVLMKYVRRRYVKEMTNMQ